MLLFPPFLVLDLFAVTFKHTVIVVITVTGINLMCIKISLLLLLLLQKYVNLNFANDGIVT